MKLPELKNKLKNKYVIRIVAGALVIALVGTSISFSNVQAAKSTAKQETTTEESTESEESEEAEDAQNALSDAINNSITLNEKEIGKEETVYIFADSTGKSKEVIVSDHLVNKDGKDTITDASTLKDIENVKGDETFVQNGNQLTWQADGNDIYYQGTTNQESPVSQKITYSLDGKEIAPEDLAGKSGKVTIRFDYTNNEKTQTTINGKKTDIYVPFVAVSGMVLDDSFSNVEVTNGKLVANGSNNLVIGYALPGLKDSLDVKKSDFDKDISIPEYFEVTADVEDFSMDMTMTVVMNATNFVSADGENDLSTIDDLLDTLTDAINQLKDGSKDLADGVDTLKSKMGEFSDGVGILKNGIKDYTDGASTLSNGIGTLKNGVDTLVGSVPTLVSGVAQLKDGSASAVEGAKELKQGTGTLHKGASDVSTGAKSLSSGAETLSSGASSLSTGAETLLTGANSLSSGAASLDEGVQSLAANMKTLEVGAKSVSDGAATLSTGVDTLIGKLGSMSNDLLNSKAGLYTQFQEKAGVAYGDEANSTLANLSKLRDNLVQGITADLLAANATDPGEKTENAVMAQTIYSGVAAALGTSISNAGEALSALTTIDNQIAGLQAAIAKVDGAASVIDTVAAGLSGEETQAQLTELQQGASALKDGSATVSSGASQLAAGAESAASGSAQVAAGASELASGASDLAKGAGELADGAGTLKKGAGTLAAGAEQVADGAKSVDTGVSSLSEGLSTLDGGLGKLKDNTGTLGSGAEQLKSGTDQLASGATTLTSNNGVLNDGAAKLADGTNAIVDGVGELDEGAHKLADGVVEFNEEGIEEIVNSYNGDIEPLVERIQAVLDAGANYQSFTDIADDVNGSVKFIIRTDAIKADAKAKD